MIAAIFQVTVALCSIGPQVDCATQVDAEVCDRNPNVPITVCAAGWGRRPRLVLQLPPCPQPGKGDPKTCTPWTIEGKVP